MSFHTSREQLKAVWRQKSDEEVAAAAEQLADYTEDAQQVIRDEMQRRHLEFTERTPMSGSIKRPPSVWMTQILLCLFCLFFLSLFFSTLVGGALTLRVLTVSTIILMFIAICAAGFFGLFKRKTYGKKIGLIILIVVWLFSLSYFFFVQDLRKVYESYNDRELFTAFLIGDGAFHGLFLILILRLAFAKKVNEFFREETVDNQA
jgi:hypothetical protein